MKDIKRPDQIQFLLFLHFFHPFSLLQNPQARSTRSPSMEPRRRQLEPATSVHAGIEERDRTIVEGDETMDEEHVEEEEKEEVQIEGEVLYWKLWCP